MSAATGRAFVAAAWVLAMAAGAMAQSPTTVLIAGRGDIMGTDPATELTASGPPAIDAAGDVALRANRNIVGNKGATDTCILLYSGTNVIQIVSTNDPENPAPGTNGAVFTQLSDPVLSGSGVLAFEGSLMVGEYGQEAVTAANDSGIWVYQSGSTSLFERTGDIPNTGQNFPVTVAFSSFQQIAVDNAGNVVSLDGLSGVNVNTTALFDGQQLVVVKGVGGGQMAPHFSAFEPLPLVQGQSRSLDTVNGYITLFGQLNVPYNRTIGLVVPPGPGITYAVETGDTAPGLGTLILKSFGEPAVNAEGAIAFPVELSGRGILASDNRAIELVSGSESSLIARTEGFAPDTSGSVGNAVFYSLNTPVLNNNGAVAFVGKLYRSEAVAALRRKEGIWSTAGGTLKEVALEGDDAPGGAGKFLSFKQIVLPDRGNVIFTATLLGVSHDADKGIWAMTDMGALECIVRTGATVSFRGTPKKIKALGVFQVAPHVAGQSRSFDASTGNLVYQAYFTDGSWGIYEVFFP